MNNMANIIPPPQKCVINNGFVNLDEGWLIKTEGSAAVALQAQYQNILSLVPAKEGKTLYLRESTSLCKEAYDVTISENGITVTAADKRGFYYALQTIRQLEYIRQLPMCIIQDAPSLNMRGFYLELLGVRRLNYKSIKQIIEKAGELKLNTIFIEYGSRFPYLKTPEVTTVDSLTREQVFSLIKIAKENYIQIIPVLQSFGHLEYALLPKKYSGLREVQEAPEQLCPSNPESFSLFKKMAEEVLEVHSNSDYFHIGGDETRQLGLCPKCRDKVKLVGKDGLFLEHISKVCEWIKDKGKKPIMWDDMLCTYPGILDKLDHDAVIMYWDYWGGSSTVPYLVPRYRPVGTRPIPKCIAYDQRWDNEWSCEIHPDYMRNFAEPMNFEFELGDDFNKQFKQYLGPQFPKYINSFPYLQFYIDKGFSVIGSPSCLGEATDMPDGLENQARSNDNIRGFAKNLTQCNAMGMVTTAWFNFPPEYLYNGIILTAHFAWNGNEI